MLESRLEKTVTRLIRHALRHSTRPTYPLHQCWQRTLRTLPTWTSESRQEVQRSGLRVPPLTRIPRPVCGLSGPWQERQTTGPFSLPTRTTQGRSARRARSGKNREGPPRRLLDGRLDGDGSSSTRARTTSFSHPRRLGSTHGSRPSTSRGAAGTAALLAVARERYPGLVSWITPEVEPAITACIDALQNFKDSYEALKGLPCPLLFWAGKEDPCFAQVQETAGQLKASLYAPEGDHVSAIVKQVPENVRALRSLFAS